ncbi:hypothetical protein S83_001150, partial [Arachis hypogaea]
VLAMSFVEFSRSPNFVMDFVLVMTSGFMKLVRALKWTIRFTWNLITAGYVEQSVYREDGADITANSLHPGTIATNLFRHMGVANVNAIGRLVLKNVQQ